MAVWSANLGPHKPTKSPGGPSLLTVDTLLQSAIRVLVRSTSHEDSMCEADTSHRTHCNAFATNHITQRITLGIADCSREAVSAVLRSVAVAPRGRLRTAPVRGSVVGVRFASGLGPPRRGRALSSRAGIARENAGPRLVLHCTHYCMYCMYCVVCIVLYVLCRVVVLCCVVLCCVVLYCVVLYCIVLYCFVLYCIVLCIYIYI